MIREVCPDCGTPQAARFCERCRYDFVARLSAAGPAPAPGEACLELVVTVDPSVAEPAAADRTPVIALRGSELLIGRRSIVKDIRPEVSLDDDAGVSHRHAKLIRDAEGWSVVDLGSQNGTELDGVLLGPGTKARIRAGSELRLGIGTTILVREH